MLFSILRGGYTPIEILVSVFALAFVIFCTMPVHEYAHALVATKLGDNTSRLAGRLTLNPMAHIDWIGALMIILVGFGSRCGSYCQYFDGGGVFAFEKHFHPLRLLCYCAGIYSVLQICRHDKRRFGCV